MKKNIIIFIIFLSFGSIRIQAQHRGDNLSMQGIFNPVNTGTRAMAMAGAFTSYSGDVNSLFYNPAGLADIDNLQISISADNYGQNWRENQDYRPNRIYWTMAFYLEGLYVPDPANNGVWDYIFAQDTNYTVREPEIGLEPYSEEAADWKKNFNDFGLSNIAAALPFKLLQNKFVISAAYRKSPIVDFDRNDTYLDPHIGFDEYGVVPRVETDTVTFSWSHFLRERKGDLHLVQGALAMDISPKLKIGFGLSSVTGESDDYQSLNRVGIFDIAKDNRFRFSYDTLNTVVRGSSDYTALYMTIGVLLKLERLSVGINVRAPYTMSRSWKTVTNKLDNTGFNAIDRSGKDKIEIPVSYSFGVNIRPVKTLMIAFDYQFTPYSKTKFNLSWIDDSQREWVDQQILRFGLEYSPYEFLSLLAGYHETPAIFVPDGAAIKDSGPKATGLTAGASLKFQKIGRIHLAYEYRKLKYYDSYYSNTNYVFENLSLFSLGYTFYL